MLAGSASHPDASGYPVRVVAERLGIPTATLRSWNQRYGIGPAREPGRHRLYTEADIAVVQRMLELVRAGASPASAAAAVTSRVRAPERGDWQPLLASAFEMDTQTMAELLGAHLRAHGVIDTWELLCRPAFAQIVERQLGGEGCVDVEHLLSWSITAALHSYIPPTAAANPRSAVLACTSGETHVLPLEALRAALAERGVGVWMLGANVPTSALSDALARTERTPVVVLWSQQESTALISAIRAGETAGARVFVGGPGWESAILPATTTGLTGLAEAVDLIIGQDH
ncbi:MerR family transcriptional regulator [Nocardia cyriacigeorgica]|uniref:MerR family transcriptional regulator n=1 Tax=Nocardia cyriacigeorgica TaxID=135487 RepID=UPI0018946DF6|nr:MerR family transcriptional regulator [Nocardia cyriacigeorgica]MBF6090456.1 MerR family transcriptional regulator [Nocardia cyriacigeorgica]MBF6093658.1 MerR family transcriptional regulator [Nocardia cyriacigeorgica]MBF6398340.1 MerR family transcriptional regulator [Nocardia cyriacigeorgica]MBF6404146.1 MerR family transcriptional regulator [Nocardia cyriacigeorgica]